MSETPASVRMIRARETMLERAPFYGVLSMYLQLHEDASIPTMSVDGRVIRFNPAFVDGLSNNEVVGVFAHEVSHCALKHTVRRGDRDPARWNEAADYETNRILLADAFILPASRLHDDRFASMTAEEIYRELEREAEEKASKGGGAGGKQGQDGDQQSGGSNAPGRAGNAASDPGGCGAVEDAAPPSSPGAAEHEANVWDANVRQALAVIKARNAGKVPGSLTGVIDIVGRSLVDWRDVLRRFAEDNIRRDYSWSNPNRRLMSAGVYMPGLVPVGVGHVVAFIDTSGSVMDPRTLASFGKELAALLDEDVCQKLTVVYADAKVKAVEEFEAGDELGKLRPIGGGGTNFRPSFDWMAANVDDASCVIYLTDMLTQDFGSNPGVPVLWAAWGNREVVARQRAKAPFGETIHVNY